MKQHNTRTVVAVLLDGLLQDEEVVGTKVGDILPESHGHVWVEGHGRLVVVQLQLLLVGGAKVKPSLLLLLFLKNRIFFLLFAVGFVLFLAGRKQNGSKGL